MRPKQILLILLSAICTLALCQTVLGPAPTDAAPLTKMTFKVTPKGKQGKALRPSKPTPDSQARSTSPYCNFNRFTSCTEFDATLVQMVGTKVTGTLSFSGEIIQRTNARGAQATLLVSSNGPLVRTGTVVPATVSFEFHDGVYKNAAPDPTKNQGIVATLSQVVDGTTTSIATTGSWYPITQNGPADYTDLQMIPFATAAGVSSPPPNTILTDNYVRCDTASSGTTKGCVFPFFAATLTTMNNLPAIAQNIKDQIANKNAPTLLHRLTDESLINANRNALCPSSIPRPPGKTCDEYPFARSYEGGDITRGGYAMVPESENQSQAGYLGTFVQNNRIVDGDPYYVFVY